MLNKYLKTKILIKVTSYVLNTGKKVRVHQNLLIVQSCGGHDGFPVKFEILFTIRSCTKTYDCNMIGISSDTMTMVVELGIPLVDIVE